MFQYKINQNKQFLAMQKQRLLFYNSAIWWKFVATAIRFISKKR